MQKGYSCFGGASRNFRSRMLKKYFGIFFESFEMVENAREWCFMMLLGLVWRDIAYLFELDASGGFMMDAC